MEIPDAVMSILEAPEMSFLPRYNREDIVSVITLAMIDVAKTANKDLYIDTREVVKTVQRQYRERFGRTPSAPTFADQYRSEKTTLKTS